MIGYIAGLALFLLSGCDSFLTQLSENNTTVANHFRSEADVEAAVYGMHTQFRDKVGPLCPDGVTGFYPPNGNNLKIPPDGQSDHRSVPCRREFVG